MTTRDPALATVEEKIERGVSLDRDDGVALLRTRDIHALGRLAKAAKERKSGKNVYYVLNRYINSTNVCYANCRFCSFARGEKEAGAVRMSADDVVAKALETGTNFNQLHIVGGHDPRQLSLDYWLPLMRRVKQLLPHVQLSLFTAAEIDYLARRHRLSYDEICAQLRGAGLDNVNGGGAEVFSARFRREVCPNKVDAAHWLEIHETLHRHGVASNATMLYGTIETLEERVEHLILLRESQARSPGYNAFIPLAFHPDGNELSHHGWTSGLDDIRMFATARLVLDNFDHIKAYWMIQGLKVCQLALDFGADDMDGTHGSTDEERIYHSAGTSSGQYVDDREFRRLIEASGYVPVRRNSTYDTFPWDWQPEPAAGTAPAAAAAEPVVA
ncbi:MAG TPA: CofH family radical SAM protein [Candidatus Elarobacter sp.]|jgi:aminodeoxyfutalosine synthase|nr:CofH family radical SAM protein [Candidatus Elarobacter sp.]